MPVMVPGIVLYWQSSGLSTFDIYLLQSVFAGAMMLLEVPTGMIADRVGKRTSLLAGQIVVAGGSVLYALGSGFWSFLAAEVTLALGMALLSGADSALLYDCLKQTGREGEHAAFEAQNHWVRLLASALSTVAGGLIAAWSLPAVMWASTVGPILAIPVAMALSDGERPAAAKDLRASLDAYLQLTGGALRFVWKHRMVRWIVAFQAILTGSATWLLWSYQPYMTLTGVPTWGVGIVFAICNLTAALVSRRAVRVAGALGPDRVFVLLALLQTLTPLLMWTVLTPLSCVFLLGHQAVRGLTRPLLTARLLEHAWADKRATVLSLSSLAGRLFFTATGPLIGWLSGALTLPQTIGAQGAILIGLFAWMGWRYAAIDEKYRRVKPDPAGQG